MFLQEKLLRFDILAFNVFKKHGNQWALVTVAREVNGNRFIKHFQTQERLLLHGRQLRCKKSNKKAEALTIMSLLDKEDAMRQKEQKLSVPKTHLTQPHFAFTNLSSGVWNYDSRGKLFFEQKYVDRRSGTIIFGRTALVIYLESRKGGAEMADWSCRVDIPYGLLEHTMPSKDSETQGSLLLTLKSPPKIYQIVSDQNLHLYSGAASAAMSQLPDLSRLLFQQSPPPQPARSLSRLCALISHHDKSAALCMVYRIRFSSIHKMRSAWNFLKDFAASGVDPGKTTVPIMRASSIEKDYKELSSTLANVTGTQISFAVTFQLTALVLEGTVSPTNMIQLIPQVCSLVSRHGSRLTAVGVRNLAQQIPTPAPNINGNDYRGKAIIEMIRANIAKPHAEAGSLLKSSTGKHPQHLALTYKATVTPTGVVLRGPEWGVSNRVLRKYSAHTECFMRVFFADEDGLSVFHDPRATQDNVYERFRSILRSGITIGNRTFEFLGFSHASLRYHAAWFMAPFDEDGVVICAKDVIHALGDFSHIRCSAKCAARIGQAFSDTVHAIRVPETANVIETKKDVMRNGRTFSDGCGTISEGLLQRVWLSLPSNRRSKRPTVLQIRYRGAKGVVSLDNALLGEQLHVRESMTKYVAREGWRDLELCGAAYRPLTMYLNHQFIKILEDLNIPMSNFFSVQDDALKTLELMVQHPIDAAAFLGMYCREWHYLSSLYLSFLHLR